MKKILNGLAVIAIMFALAACGKTSTSPSTIVSQSLQAEINKDYATWMDCMDIPADVTEEERTELIQMLEALEQDGNGPKNHIQSFEILSEELAEDGNSALVRVKVNVDNNTSDEMEFPVIKNAAGEWKISFE